MFLRHPNIFVLNWLIPLSKRLMIGNLLFYNFIKMNERYWNILCVEAWKLHWTPWVSLGFIIINEFVDYSKVITAHPCLCHSRGKQSLGISINVDTVTLGSSHNQSRSIGISAAGRTVNASWVDSRFNSALKSLNINATDWDRLSGYRSIVIYFSKKLFLR